VIGKAGLALGGRDLDRWIAAELCPGAPLEGALLQAAESLKCQLSSQEEALAFWTPQGPGQPPQLLRLSRSALNNLLRQRGLLAELDDLLEGVLAAARREGLAPVRRESTCHQRERGSDGASHQRPDEALRGPGRPALGLRGLARENLALWRLRLGPVIIGGGRRRRRWLLVHRQPAGSAHTQRRTLAQHDDHQERDHVRPVNHRVMLLNAVFSIDG
jgi:hypothetical protein